MVHDGPFIRAFFISAMTLDELRCQCGRAECDAPAPDPALLETLQAIEDDVRLNGGEPPVITSGVRCRFWNQKQGGAARSGHLRSTEADIACLTNAQRWRIVGAAIRLGIRRIGIGKTFVHLGLPSDLPQGVIWTYY
jgi:hypothetical protein